MPQISVILPNYNHALFLVDRIESILNQTYTDYEIIIIDDASTDGSRQILCAYENNQRVSRVIYEQRNSGSPFIQWNKGIDLAKGEWIWIAESDDTAEPELLEQLYSLATKNPEVVLAYSQSNRMDENGIKTGTWKEWTDGMDASMFEQNFTMGGLDYINEFLINKNTIPNASAVLFKKSVFHFVGKADEEVRNCSDWLLWLKMATQGEIAYCAECLNNFRYSDSSVIASAVKDKKISFFKKYDIEMRSRFDSFLKKQSVQFREVEKLNRLKLGLEIAQECRWLLGRKNYKVFMTYLFRYFVILFQNPLQASVICLETSKLFKFSNKTV